MLPHDWIAALSKAGMEEEVLGRSKMGGFWAGHDMSDPKFHDNPVTAVTDLASSMLPLQLHGDAARFQLRESILVISMRSILAHRSIRRSQLLLAAVPKGCKVQAAQADTWKEIWQVITWSLRACFHGRHPDTDHKLKPFPPDSARGQLAGQPLSSANLRGMVYAVSGDMDFLSSELGLAHHAQKQPCFKCGANSDTAPWNDLRPNALCRELVYMPEANKASPPTQHLLMSVPGVNTYTFALDMTHILDLGCTQHLLGNLLFELVYEEAPGSCEDSMQEVFDRILGLYQELGVDSSNRISTLKLENICNPDRPHKEFPLLKGVKARETRYLAPVCLALCRSFEGASTRHTEGCASKAWSRPMTLWTRAIPS